MSMLPLKFAPSAMPTRGAKMLPFTFAEARIDTDSLAKMSPSTRPSTITNLARMLPVTPPSLPIDRLRVCSIEPSSWPWNSRSSSPYSSPLKCSVGPSTQVPVATSFCGAGAGGAILFSKPLLMVFSGSAACAGDGGSLRPSIRFHGDSAIEIRSLCDADARRANVAAHDRRLTDLDALAGDHVALDFAVDVDARGIHRSDDLALGTDDHTLLVVNRA